MEKLKSRIFHSIAKIGGVLDIASTKFSPQSPGKCNFSVIRDWVWGWEDYAAQGGITLGLPPLNLEIKGDKVTGIQKQWDKKNLPGHYKKKKNGQRKLSQSSKIWEKEIKKSRGKY